MILIALNHASLRERIGAALSPEEVRDPVLRRIFVEFVRGGGAAEGARPTSLLPPEIERRLTALWAAADVEHLPEEAGALDRIVEDCLARIRERGVRQERTVFRQALEAADRQGDPDRVLKLLAEHPSVKGGDKTT